MNEKEYYLKIITEKILSLNSKIDNNPLSKSFLYENSLIPVSKLGDSETIRLVSEAYKKGLKRGISDTLSLALKENLI